MPGVGVGCGSACGDLPTGDGIGYDIQASG